MMMEWMEGEPYPDGWVIARWEDWRLLIQPYRRNWLTWAFTAGKHEEPSEFDTIEEAKSHLEEFIAGIA